MILLALGYEHENYTLPLPSQNKNRIKKKAESRVHTSISQVMRANLCVKLSSREWPTYGQILKQESSQSSQSAFSSNKYIHFVKLIVNLLKYLKLETLFQVTE